MQVCGYSFPLLYYAGHADLWIIFFVIGIALRKSSRQYSLKFMVIATFVAFLLQILESYFLQSFNGGGYGIKLSSFLFSLFLILCLFHPTMVSSYSEKSKVAKLIRVIGDCSFGIYLVHCLIIMAYRILVLPDELTFLIVLPVSFIFVYSSRKLLPKSINQYLGF